MSGLKNSVLACIDGSNSSSAVCDYAAWIANTINLPLTLLHSVSNDQPPATDLSGSIGLGAREELLSELAELEQQRAKLLLQDGKAMLANAAKRCQEHGVSAVSTLQRHGSLAESLIDLESETRVLVMGLRGESHDKSRFGVGHRLESVIRALHRPMLIVNQPFIEPKNVLLAYDGSDSANKALEMVCQSTLFKQITCHVVYAGEDEDRAQSQLSLAEQALTKAGINTVMVKLDHSLDQGIADLQDSNAIDLMIMGAFSHSRLRDLLLGSLTSKVLQNTAKPLLLLR
ncbi:hypothetical protein SIN8267_01792 [Sinobacterium norvegicum]|uniref:UspA domain-containing protein n=1 Tax=Sinobacterium norvegicum TaxID=1641715 RepID=A0ABN8EKJ1_9GAMM|nr:universal stress protein [Sinobacterium norvegicum]CAH0991680.1 hypothetical protein SIN8267_01792 [Sinobacterium norvegicum]